ncbi:MAG: tetratricopeptide repeat protein [Fimbriiglobus sp.]
MTLEDIFHAALEIADSKDRHAYLDQACCGNIALRKEVAELLASHSRSQPFLDVPVAEQLQEETATVGFDPELNTTEASDLIGLTLDGKYKLVEAIGEGGMGTVFMAQQLAPIRRAVAVKVVKAGMDSKAVLARFEAERQALALMDHPNIAKVLDGGTTPAGRPYFVMELVKGVPITEFCDELKLSPRQRLELFVPVCQAIQHAHQKGIIHRDIKPSNVLIALYDDKAVPKVIDFGVAKATEHGLLTEESMMTGFGAVLGTPVYMSPEQASLNNLDIDTRSDVYSLGVLLYELLTGSTPVDRKSMVRAGLLEMLRVVREVEAAKPSEKLSTIGDARKVAENRGMDQAKLSKFFRGEIDCVVLKAIEKDLTRRYESANSFARDIERYLANEIVEARPASRGYRLRKFVSHHKVFVFTTLLVMTALFVGVIGTTWQAIRAEQARAAEMERAEGERLAKLEAEAAKELTAARLKQIENINDTVFDIFQGLDIRQAKADGKPIEAILALEIQKAGEKLDAKAIQDPDVLAKLRSRLGQTLISLGFDKEAIPFLKAAFEHRQSALGRDARETLATMNTLAMAYKGTGKLSEAVALAEEDYALAKAKHGPEHSSTLIRMNNLALAYSAAGQEQKALELHEKCLKIRRANLPPDDPAILHAMNNLASVYKAAGKMDLALPLQEEACEKMKANLGPDHVDTLTLMANLMRLYRDMGQSDKAIALGTDTLQRRRAKLGDDHPDTIMSLSNLALAYFKAGTPGRAVPILEEVLTAAQAKHGPEHPRTLTFMNNLAVNYAAIGQFTKARELYQQVLTIRRKTLGADHPATLTSINNLGNAYLTEKNYPQAIPLLQEALRRRLTTLPPDHPDTLASRKTLALAYEEAKDFALAEVCFREHYEAVKRKAGPESAEAVFSLRHVAENLVDQKKFAEAEPLSRECVAIYEKLDPLGWDLSKMLSFLGRVLLAQGKTTEAESVLLRAYDGLKRHQRTDKSARIQLKLTAQRLITLYTKTKKTDDLAKWQAEAKLHETPKD